MALIIELNLSIFSFRGRESFRRMCSLTKEPEDVTVGFVVGKYIKLNDNYFFKYIHVCDYSRDFTRPGTKPDRFDS